MFALSYRTSCTLFGISSLLSSALAQAQSNSNAAAPVRAETGAQPAAVGLTQPIPAPQPEVAPNDGPQTLFRAGTKVGGFGGLDVGYTRIAGKNAALLCGGGALLMDHRFSLGLIGCGNGTRISGQNYGDVVHESGDRLEFGYGGLVLGYQFFPTQVYNLSLTAMVGGGGAAIANYRDGAWHDDDLNEHRHLKTSDTLFVAEPRLTGYVNLTRWARMGVFAGYRFVGGVDMKNLSSSDLSGPVAGGTIQFGWF